MKRQRPEIIGLSTAGPGHVIDFRDLERHTALRSDPASHLRELSARRSGIGPGLDALVSHA